MARVGLDARTGRPLYGWAHCVQSITKNLTTELKERVQRRGFGSGLVSHIDDPQNEEHVIDLYEAAASAIEPRMVDGRECGEPGFDLLRASIDASEPGKITLLLSGVFFEHGHLGDYSNPSEKQIIYAVTEQAGSVSFAAVA